MKKNSRLLNQLWHFTNRNSQHILTVCGALGVGITAYLAVKADKQWSSKVSEYAETPNRSQLMKDAISTFWKPAASEIITIGCIFGSDIISARKLHASNCAYNRLNTNFAEYRAAVIGALGMEANKKALRYADSKRIIEVPTEPELPAGYFHFYDDFSRNDFVATLADVIDAQYRLNYIFSENGEARANDFYKFLGAPLIERGDELGWDIGEMMDYWGIAWIDFYNEEHEEEDGSKWYTIHMQQYPTIDGIIDADAWIADAQRNGITDKQCAEIG